MVGDFIPEIWSANINSALSKVLVYGSTGVVNRDYEGEIQQAGNTVNITSFTDPTVRTYTSESDITVDSIADDTLALVVDQQKYFAFDVDDVIKRQALPGWVEEMTSRGAYKLMDTIDQYIVAAMYTAINGSATDLGGVTADISDNSGFGNVLVALRAELNANNVPQAGRWVVIHTDLEAALLQDNRFLDASAYGNADPIQNGRIGRAVGFDVYVSNNVPAETTGVYSVIAGHPLATTFASQITETKAQERELRFGYLVKSLMVYGCKVIRPEALALASVTVQA